MAILKSPVSRIAVASSNQAHPPPDAVAASPILAEGSIEERQHHRAAIAMRKKSGNRPIAAPGE